MVIDISMISTVSKLTAKTRRTNTYAQSQGEEVLIYIYRRHKTTLEKLDWLSTDFIMKPMVLHVYLVYIIMEPRPTTSKIQLGQYHVISLLPRILFL